MWILKGIGELGVGAAAPMFAENSRFAKPVGGLILNVIEQVQDAGQVLVALFADVCVHNADGAEERFLLSAQQFPVHARQIGHDAYPLGG